MEILERLWEKSKNSPSFMPRKIALNDSRAILCGPPKSGKSSLAKSYLKEHERSLYLNLKDPRVESSLSTITQHLAPFCQKNQIQALAIDNYTPGFPLPNAESILLVSEKRIEARGYTRYSLRGLDFEEYLSFDRRHQSVRHLFNSFLKDGSLPEISLCEDSKKSERKQEILRLLCANESEFFILQGLLSHMGHKVSAHQLYTHLKKRIQLSKDRIYAVFLDYQARGILHLIEKFEQKSAPKKLFFWDFTLANALSYERNFGALVENMVFLELLKQNEEIAYTDKVDLLLPGHELGVLVMPFATPENVEARLAKIREEREFLESFLIISMGLNHEGESLGTPYTVLPFWEFALGEKE